MSYYMNYTITFDVPEINDTFIQELKEKDIEIPEDVTITQSKKSFKWKIIEEMEKEHPNGYRLIEFLDGQTVSWYGFQDAMKELSKKFPSVVFVVDVNNREEFTDFYKQYYKNGLYYMQEPTITYPPFDEDKLK